MLLFKYLFKKFNIDPVHFVILLVISLFLFFASFYLYGGEAWQHATTGTTHHLIMNQPDEMAHYFFVKNILINKTFGAFESLSQLGLSHVHPRSVTVVSEYMVPIGFPFFIVLLAMLAFLPVFLFGQDIVHLIMAAVIPFAGVLAILLMYAIVKRVWDARIALISAGILAVIPPWLYYTSRPLQYTILFVTFLLLSMWGVVRFRDAVDRNEKIAFIIISALGLSLALAIRPVELVWVVGVFAYILFLIRSSWVARDAYIFVGTILMVMSVFFVIQYAFYGSPFASGYVAPLPTGEAGNVIGGGQGISFVRAFLFPFGIDIFVALKTGWIYIYQLMSPWSLWVIASYLFVAIRGDRSMRMYLVGWTIVSLYLLLFYGSWGFSDNLLGVPTLGGSQIRYLMPVFVGAAPIFAYACARVWTLLDTKKQIFFSIFVGLLLLLSSFRLVYTSYPEGLMYVKQTIEVFRERQNSLYAHTSEYGVVVTRYGDKYIFPGRKVIIRVPEHTEWVEAVSRLLQQGVPVYWYDIALSDSEREDMNNLFAEHSFDWRGVLDTWDNLELIELGLKKTQE